jgi:DNA helicase-2/ATP-dependent DNA helicase PcrA
MPIYYHAKNRDDEASFISQKIKEYHDSGTSYKDMAILYRTNHHSRFLEEELRKNHIPYIIYGNLAFYERKEIKDLLSYLRFVVTQDDLAFERIINSPARAFGPKKLMILKEAQRQNGKSLYENLLLLKDDPTIKKSKAASFLDLMKEISKKEEIPKVSELLSELYQKSGYEKMITLEADDERIGNINELFAGIKEREEAEDGDLTLEEYLDSIALLSSLDEMDRKDKDEVRLMTAHLSKGQEFQIVFICCLNENNFPTSRSNTVDKLEEERRLFYVATTRAKDILYLTDADGYDFSSGELVPSRFLYDIDPILLTWMGEKINQAPPLILPLRGKESVDVTTLYARGEKVSHPVFGLGMIVELDIPNSTYLVQFENMASPRSIAFDFPNLLKVIEEKTN